MTATTAKAERAPTERTEHPHIVRTPGVLGRQSRIDGTRISVGHVFVLYRDNGDTPETIASTYGLELAHVLDALSYAYDHPEEMDEFVEGQKLRTVLRVNDMVYAGGRLIPREHIAKFAIPPGTPIYTWETLPEELGP